MDPLAERLKNMTPLQRAVFALKETQARLDALQQKRNEPIAIVGMACRFPGGVWNTEDYWRLLRDGVDAISLTPKQRWDTDALYDPDPQAPGKLNSRWGGFLDRIDEFDNHFFGISDREAMMLDPQQRMLLELAWEALEDAGLPPCTFRNSRTGVYLGISHSEYGVIMAGDLAQTGAHVASGTSLSMAANRLSFTFGLSGPSIALDTACSSALVALHMACQNIRSGECEAALACGANLLLMPVGNINLTKAGFSAPDGRVRAFDAQANGYVRSEGLGVIVLKPLAAALAGGDRIHAVIRGSAVNQNGTGNGLTAPNRPSQEQVLREAYARAGISPGQVQLVEAHGTGTRLGDALEALALGNVLGEGRPEGERCAIGSVKSNLGHMEAAAGMASLMKVVLAMTHGQLPPSLNYQSPNPDVPFARLPIKVQDRLEPWPARSGPRLAGVSAFGFGGSNAHVVVEEAPRPAAEENVPPAAGRRDILALSARTEKALADLARSYTTYLDQDPPRWDDICYTAAARREHHDCRLAVLADSHQAARAELQRFVESKGAGVLCGRKPFGRNLKIALVYDDRPDPWRACAAQLIDCVPGFAAALEEIAATFERVAAWPLASMLNAAAGWDDPARACAATVALQLAMTSWWRAAGVAADVVLGRGSGELTAACVAGMLSGEDALRLALTPSAAAAARPAMLPFISSVDGRPHRGPDLDAHHWSRCRTSAGEFVAALGELRQRSVDVCLEVGPASLLGELQTTGLTVAATLSCSVTGRFDTQTALATVYAAGADLNWSRLVPPGGRCVRLPTYPWQRRAFWAPVKTALIPAAAVSDAPQAKQASESLPTPAVQPRPDLTTPYVAPRTDLECQLAQAWSEVLRIEPVGIHDNFFELGGDSLRATMLLSRMQEQPLREIFLSPTIAALAERIETARAEGKQSRGLIPQASRDGQLLPSFTQEALWFLDQLERDEATYTIYSPLRVRGPLNVATAERALNEIARRHEILRTTFPEVDGRPLQRIAPYAPRPLPVVDFSQRPPAVREMEARQWIFEELGRKIDLQNGPLIRVTLLRLADDDHMVMVSTHHIIYDGWSMGVLIRELTILYTAFELGHPSPLPELPIQYADFAAWQRNYLQGETFERLREYWGGQLSGVAPLEMPSDYPRPAIRTTRGATRAFRLSPALSEALLDFCRREGTTPFMTLLAALEVLLRRSSGQDDFAIGSPVANRNLPETETLIGYFVNVVVLRSRVAGDPTFRELLDRVRQTALDAFEHQDMTLDQVVEAVNPPRDMSRHPLFQVMFALQNIELNRDNPFGVTIGPVEDGPLARSAFFDLTLAIWQAGAVFSAELNYRTELFTAETIDRMIERLEVLLAGAIAAPDRPLSALPWLAPREERQILDEWCGTTAEYDAQTTFHEVFAKQAEQSPDAVAVVLDERRWTYRELERRSNRLARFLKSQGVGLESRVGICLERSPELLMAVLGVLKAGGTYVPLDPTYSRTAAERSEYVLDDARVTLVVTDAALAETVEIEPDRRIVIDGPAAADIAAQSDAPPANVAGSQSLAYVLYTSGSTGRPKGVMVTHRNLLNALCGWQQAYCLDTEVRSHLQMASFGFDVFAGDMVRALGSGGKLVICRKDLLLEPEALLNLLRREAIDMAEFVPVVLRSLVEHLEKTGGRLDFMRLVVVGSDIWHVADHKRAWRVLEPQTRLINSYGLTETTIDSTYFEGDVRALADTAMVPIGRPFPNVRLYVLDEHMRPVPIGVAGVLYIGGDGVSQGYVNTELNADRFVADPFEQSSRHTPCAVTALDTANTPLATARADGTRSMPATLGGCGTRSVPATLCRTGDLVRWRPDGQLEFLGRADNQVKIRGFRIEPGEVEQVLSEHPALARAVVVARERTPGDLQLVAYMVGRSGEVPDGHQLRQYLARRVPEYMIPSAFVTVGGIPTTTSGKIDRQALPAPDWSQQALRGEYVAPRTPTEEALAAIWAEVLGMEQVGVHDDFFALGGHSLLGLRVMSKIRETMTVDVPLVQLFIAPTIAGLADTVDKIRAGVDVRSFLTQPAVNWEAECELDPAVRVTSDLRPAVAVPQRVLLTGATGFLGAFLLRELLARTTAEIHCLVRARRVDEARAKLVRNLRQYGLGDVGPMERVVPVCGDFSEARLGLSPDEFHKLAETVEVVYHNGAQVSPFFTYDMLKPGNVLGTVEILRLATQDRLKPVHFVSTVSVFESPEYQPFGRLDETTPLEFFGTLTSGYAQTKTVAEQLVREAGRRGVPVAIYRPGRITADTDSGAASVSDQTALIIKLCVELGVAPLAESEVDLTPVDYVARAIATLSTSGDAYGRVFHLLNPQPVPVGSIYEAIRAAGYALESVPFERWRSHVIHEGAGSSNEILAALAHALVVDVPASAGEAEARPPAKIECQRTLEALRPAGISCPVVDAAALAQYLGFLQSKGVLGDPAAEASTRTS